MMGKWLKYIIKNNFTFLMWVLKTFKLHIWLALVAHIIFVLGRAALEEQQMKATTSTVLSVQPRIQVHLLSAAPLRSCDPGSLGLHPPLTRTCRDVEWDGFESLIQFGENNYLNNIEPSNRWTRIIFPIMSVSSNVSQQCFAVFIIAVLVVFC